MLPLHDVGMTGLYLSMLDSLSELAAAVGRATVAADLRARHAAMAKTMTKTKKINCSV